MIAVHVGDDDGVNGFQAEVFPHPIEGGVEERLVQQPAVHHERASGRGEDQAEVPEETGALELEDTGRDLPDVRNDGGGGDLVLIGGSASSTS